MTNDHSLTIVVTAYNEEDFLKLTIKTLAGALEGIIDDYEILIIDDASFDDTPRVANNLVKENSKIKYIRNLKNLNQGGCYKKSIRLATKEFYYLLPGDNMIEAESLRQIISATGQADLILPYIDNYNVRHPFRKLVSLAFVKALNFLFGLRLKYYNGPIIVKTDLLRQIKVSNSFMFMADTVVKLLNHGYSYIELPMRFNADEKGANIKAIRRNFFPVIKNILSLFWRIRVKRRY